MDPWSDRTTLRDVQYATEANLAARQSIYAYQHPPADLRALVLDLAALHGDETFVDVGCGNGLLAREFATVTRHDRTGELRLPDAGPLEAYARSLPAGAGRDAAARSVPDPHPYRRARRVLTPTWDSVWPSDNCPEYGQRGAGVTPVRRRPARMPAWQKPATAQGPGWN